MLMRDPQTLANSASAVSLPERKEKESLRFSAFIIEPP